MIKYYRYALQGHCVKISNFDDLMCCIMGHKLCFVSQVDHVDFPELICLGLI